ncbi:MULTISPECIES: efflux transporter outer membrane subunit [Xanthomonas]|uniref:efflux transporter outer membrane subunit n=1 Tax=Xanthomonas TaxID=338 RepID=UPI001ADCF311|nr:efflux transporter outer membrane subunit [Xanthomonas phaseoli]MBO9769076.1 efflux transporter outer membrane subunit [Xanthomonas phaseoli pv. dieffenbachiae]MBO9777453.1 efflux transporter outer membrane subunit [Xanthomonas phaseoli pv. dieffenbachiae]MBO9780562.1 efflux transporter outer membrane subunit [Xanthomonas phaseoli pv. dieffenbachiae]MBO9796459.1 efflux transporter outer membrane subunit [Xanthomonas phaseoli pv. dieffenbachiae]MBO9800494.1 efflux transporter outer membrane 
MRYRVASVAVACAIALSGCVSMAPQYARPDAAVPSVIGDTGSTGNAGTGMPNVAALDWRQVVTDARLQQVVALALDNNRDLRVAVLNIEQARAQYRIQRADLFPSVDATVSHTAQRAAAATSFTGAPQIIRSASGQVGISSWELDLFGRIRSLKNQALENYLASEQTQRSTRLSLVAEVANDWLTVAADQQRLALAQQTLDSQRQTLRLTELQHDNGIVSGLDLAQIQTSVESARADVANYTTQLAQSRNALNLVVGTSVPAALLPASDAIETGVALAPLPVQLESRVLLQRPDVLSAEHTLKAANADIGAARAAFFPTISLTANAGRGSDALSSLFDGDHTWSFSPSVSLPIFRAGALKAELDVTTLQKDITIAQYELAIQTAFSEVADALAERTQLEERRHAQQAMVAAAQRSFHLSDARYRSGVDSYLVALDAQRTLYSAQQTLISLRLTEASNRVTVYKVLGGGADAQSVVVSTQAPAPQR